MPSTRRQAAATKQSRPADDIVGTREMAGNDQAGESTSDGEAIVHASVNEATKEYELRMAELRMREMQIKMETEIKLKEIESRERIAMERMRTGQAMGLLEETGSLETVVGTEHRIASYSKQLRAVLKEMPSQNEYIPNWFVMTETIMKTCGVPEELWGQLILPFLSEKGRRIFCRLDNEGIAQYKDIKDAILSEHRLAPADYLRSFLQAEKGERETWYQFGARIKDLYHYYVTSRGVKTLDDLIALSVADQFKAKLVGPMKSYVTLQEGAHWNKADQLAAYCEKYEEAHVNNRQGVGAGGDAEESHYYGDRNGRKPGENMRLGGQKTLVGDFWTDNKRNGAMRNSIVCHNCGGIGHYQRECRKPRSSGPKGENISITGGPQATPSPQISSVK